MFIMAAESATFSRELPVNKLDSRPQTDGTVSRPSGTSHGKRRRAVARKLLSTSVQDRKLPSALRWTRSLTEVKIPRYKEQCRYIGKSNLLGTQKSRAEQEENSRGNHDNSYVHHDGEDNLLTLPTITSTTSTMLTVNSKSGPKSRDSYGEVKLRDLYSVLYDNRPHTNGGINKKLRISIHSQKGTNGPRVRVSVKSSRKQSSEIFQTNAETPDTKLPEVARPYAFGCVHAREDAVSSNRGRINGENIPVPSLLQRLDRARLSTAEKTRRWLLINPVGLLETAREPTPDVTNFQRAQKQHKQVRFEEPVSSEEEFSL